MRNSPGRWPPICRSDLFNLHSEVVTLEAGMAPLNAARTGVVVDNLVGGTRRRESGFAQRNAVGLSRRRIHVGGLLQPRSITRPPIKLGRGPHYEAFRGTLSVTTLSTNGERQRLWYQSSPFGH